MSSVQTEPLVKFVVGGTFPSVVTGRNATSQQSRCAAPVVEDAHAPSGGSASGHENAIERGVFAGI